MTKLVVNFPNSTEHFLIILFFYLSYKYGIINEFYNVYNSTDYSSIFIIIIIICIIFFIFFIYIYVKKIHAIFGVQSFKVQSFDVGSFEVDSDS
jgi:hypothetical protein